MKKLLLLLIAISIFKFTTAHEKDPITIGVDINNGYIFRGTQMGTGPVFQPVIKYNKNNFTIGSWGSYCFNGNEGSESDLFVSYDFTIGKTVLNFTLTDFYFYSETLPYLSCESHYLEPQVNFAVGKIKFIGAYMLNANSTYLETNYNTKYITLFVGAGDGQYTKDEYFNLCNVGVKSTKSIKINEHFSIPITGSLILNPSKELFYVVVGITLSNQ